MPFGIRSFGRFARQRRLQRTIIWSDTERCLDLEQSIQRVQKHCPGIQRERIEDFLLVWIELGYDPENYSEEQLDELSTNSPSNGL